MNGVDTNKHWPQSDSILASYWVSAFHAMMLLGIEYECNGTWMGCRVIVNSGRVHLLSILFPHLCLKAPETALASGLCARRMGEK
jgi:hypothetical protein